MVAWFVIERSDDDTYRLTDGWYYVGCGKLTKDKDEAVVYNSYTEAYECGQAVLKNNPHYGKFGHV